MSNSLKTMHLTSSRFFGGPERQMLGLALEMRPSVETIFASFSESGLNQAFLAEIESAGLKGIGLRFDTPRLFKARREIVDLIRDENIKILVCHGYKAGIVGWFAARKAKIPVIAVSRGWTAESWKVKFYEYLDRKMLQRMDKVVCVSKAQASKVQAAGVAAQKIEVIHNSVRTDRFATPDRNYRQKMLDFFPEDRRSQLRYLVGAAGRLSPEKGFDVLVRAAHLVTQDIENIGFVLFGEGVLGDQLQQQIQTLNLKNQFILAGFTKELDRFLPFFDLFVQSSNTEGLPNVLLESLAAGVPVVATDVGGTAELVQNREQGFLVPPADPEQLAKLIKLAVSEPDQLKEMAQSGKNWVDQNFTFARQARDYQSLFSELTHLVSA